MVMGEVVMHSSELPLYRSVREYSLLGSGGEMTIGTIR
eukprot:CAMPEP_0172307114 /NCGR_PEP_ID=MMETSP1058-20130122/8037_1 /TAXON_ID=83371 /ORGANISM="Detonula confervacea, Strain CCMP 353" /LENGTH=37 /DNA_ID= /DNA_START= /DNA_END= /DNA_ORIENTATION=